MKYCKMQKIILTTESAKHFDLESGKMEIGRFPGGEVSLRVHENVARADVFVVGSTNAPAENLVELLLAIDTVNRLKAKSIAAVIPYFAYARADREKFPGDAVSADAVTKMLESVGGENFSVASLDFHSPKAESFFKSQFRSIDTSELFIGKIKDLGNLTLVAPDKGAEAKMLELAKKMGIEQVAVLQKERFEDGTVAINGVTGSIGPKVLMLDDIIDSGGTIIKSAEFLGSHGASEIYVAATHTVWQGGGYKKLAESDLFKKIYTTDTIAPPGDLPEKIEVLSVAPILEKIING